ncbi:MAG: heme-binding protein, partial [Rhodocyclaceae bacterium]|nr:heme-binding protein [Rhodocyclaceae bacterium]
NTTGLAEISQPGKPASGLRNLPNVVALGGGVPIEGGGSILGGIGVSGAPSAEADDKCAKAGIAAIRDALEL